MWNSIWISLASDILFKPRTPIWDRIIGLVKSPSFHGVYPRNCRKSRAEAWIKFLSLSSLGNPSFRP